MPFDLGDVQEIPGLVKKLRKDFGPIYGLVNNAALGSDGALALMHTSQIERLIRLNTLSPIVLTKYVVRHMMADGGGRVVNVAVDRRLHRIQRPVGLQRDEGVLDRVHAIAGARGRPARRQRQRRRARDSSTPR